MAAHSSGCVFTAVNVHSGWVKCKAQIPSMGNHTLPHVTSLSDIVIRNLKIQQLTRRHCYTEGGCKWLPSPSASPSPPPATFVRVSASDEGFGPPLPGSSAAGHSLSFSGGYHHLYCYSWLYCWSSILKGKSLITAQYFLIVYWASYTTYQFFSFALFSV